MARSRRSGSGKSKEELELLRRQSNEIDTWKSPYMDKLQRAGRDFLIRRSGNGGRGKVRPSKNGGR